LQTVTMPTGICSIGANAFAGCTSITKLVLSKATNLLGANVFSGWTDAQTVCYEDSAFVANNTWIAGWNNGSNATFTPNYVPAN